MKDYKIVAIVLAIILTLKFTEIVPAEGTPIYSMFNFHAVNESSAAIQLPFAEKKNTIQVALLLDTSNSMDGLIEQAKSQLWQILNTLANTEKINEETTLEIALYEYGNTSNQGKEGHQIRQVSEFTTDMDVISEKLFELTTNGGEEYCGQVIMTSLENLAWGADDSNLKMIYIAGNEPFTQGPIHYAKACQTALQKGIVVNTIFCGSHEEGISSMWQQGAQLTDGIYLNIDHNKSTTYIETPFDDSINALNLKLNTTYIPCGTMGSAKLERQQKEDANAMRYSKANCADRVVFKSSGKYKAYDWDLVDAYEKDKSVLTNGTIDLNTINDSLRQLSTEELEAKIQSYTEERKAIQHEIQKLSKQRQTYILEQSKDSEEENNLKKSIQKSVKKQASSKGFTIKE